MYPSYFTSVSARQARPSAGIRGSAEPGVLPEEHDKLPDREPGIPQRLLEALSAVRLQGRQPRGVLRRYGPAAKELADLPDAPLLLLQPLQRRIGPAARPRGLWAGAARPPCRARSESRCSARRGEQPVGLLGAEGDQVVDQHADVGLRAGEDERLLPRRKSAALMPATRPCAAASS